MKSIKQLLIFSLVTGICFSIQSSDQPKLPEIVTNILTAGSDLTIDAMFITQIGVAKVTGNKPRQKQLQFCAEYFKDLKNAVAAAGMDQKQRDYQMSLFDADQLSTCARAATSFSSSGLKKDK